MMINLNKIINDFISGTIKLDDVIEKSGISYFKLVDYIKKYCMENNILMDEDISYRLNAPISEILNLLRQNITYKEISKVYKCSSQTLKNRLVKYCEKNNTELPKVNRGPKEKPLPMEDIYELKKQGLTYEEIGEKYSCTHDTIRRRLKEYCEQNNLETSKTNKGPIEKFLPMKEIYELKKQGLTYEEIGEKYDCASKTIIRRLKKYCRQNNLEILKSSPGPEAIKLPMEEIYKLKSQGMSYTKIEEKYSCTYVTIKKRLKEYCKQNNLEIPKTKRKPRARIIELPIEEIYKLKSQGMSYRKIAEKYSCTYETIRQRLTEYEDELVLRNKYLEILLFDFNKIKDNVLFKTTGSFYGDNEDKKHDDYPFIKK